MQFVIAGLLAAMLAAFTAPLASAQTPAAPGPSLDPGHWSYDLLEAVDLLGWDDARSRWSSHAWLREMRPAGAPLLDTALGEAGSAADTAGDVGRAALVRTWRGALARETPGPYALDLRGGVRAGDGLFLPGEGLHGSLGGRADVGPVTAWARYGGGGWDGLPNLREGGVAVRWGAFDVRAGRQPFHLGPGLADLIMGGRVPIDAVTVQSSRPHTLPGFLSVLGPLTVHGGLGYLHETGHVNHAMFGATNLTFQPHHRVHVGLWRIARFGGDALPATTFRRVLNVVLGNHNRPNYEDQMAAFSLRVRWNAWGQPLSTYTSVGFKDSDGAHYRDPALVLGALAPVETSSGLVTLRYELSSMGKRAQRIVCFACTYHSRNWYDHGQYGEWTVGGIQMGDPLGGYGMKHTLRAEQWFEETPLRIHLQLDHTTREDRNLQLDRWPGVRRRIELGTYLQAGRGFTLSAAGEVARNRLAGTQWGLELEAGYTFEIGEGR